VLAPCLVAAAMIAAGLWHLRREARGLPIRIGGRHWTGILLGALILIVSFTLDFRNILSGGLPRPFAWGVFSLGLATGLGSYATAAVQRVPREEAEAARVAV